jgi:PelA/Pel-15E family pectate lyase
MQLVRDISEGDPEFAFTSDGLRKECAGAYERAIDCVLNMQIKQNGMPAGWCAQHEPKTLAPAWARSYEPPSINSSEPTEVVLLLMQIPDPDERVQAAVHGAAAWFERSKITGKRVEMRTGEQYEIGKDRVLVDDPSAPPIWARFYDIETNEPIFMDRDGKRYPSMADLPAERRVGYAWYSNNGNKVLKEYADWKARQAPRSDRGEK